MEFDWDAGNIDKNLKHSVHDWEIEEAFKDKHRLPAGKMKVKGEERHILLARCETSGKYLRIVYTIRKKYGKKLVRPISATEMSRSNKRRYKRKK
jgi:uncharacterized DUF497 family protein